jgi:ADP-ribose pyrophosphatase YjhB (NUDIX family)
MPDKKTYSGAVIFRSNGSILLQMRDKKPNITNPGRLTTFGGTALAGERALDTLQRELFEEVALQIRISEAVFLGKYLKREDEQEVDCYFYAVFDRDQSVNSTTEGQLVLIANVDVAISDSRVTPASAWALKRFRQRQEFIMTLAAKRA